MEQLQQQEVPGAHRVEWAEGHREWDEEIQ